MSVVIVNDVKELILTDGEVSNRNLRDYLIAEGKTKYIFSHKEPDKVIMVFKDDITAGDGAKHDVIQDKDVIDWQTNKDIFEFLNAQGINTHYIDSPGETVSVVKKLDQKINLEVVSRRIATGSILKHTGLVEGEVFRPIYTQFFYKDDFLHDPLLNEDFIQHITRNKNCNLFKEMEYDNAATFTALEAAFAQFNIQLVDIKLEYGIVDGKLTLIDEITGGSFRLWPYTEGIDVIDWSAKKCWLPKEVLNLLNPKGRLDKDLYRRGEVSLDTVRNKFQEIAKITAQFKNLKLDLCDKPIE